MSYTIASRLSRCASLHATLVPHSVHDDQRIVTDLAAIREEAMPSGGITPQSGADSVCVDSSASIIAPVALWLHVRLV